MNHGAGKEGSRPISDLDACENFAWRSYVADIIVAYGTGCWETMANRGGDRSHVNGYACFESISLENHSINCREGYEKISVNSSINK